MCVTIRTGRGYWDNGYLSYDINGDTEVEVDYDAGVLVYHKCRDITEGLNIKLWSDKDNAWVGTIVITEGGRPTLLYCKKCHGRKWIHTPSPEGNNLIVEADKNGIGGRGHCREQARCEIIWARFGTVEILIVYLMKP